MGVRGVKNNAGLSLKAASLKGSNTPAEAQAILNEAVYYVDAATTNSLPGYVYLPGITGYDLTVPDEAALDITGDLDLRALVAADNWTGARSIVGKWQSSQKSYLLTTNSSGGLEFYWTTNGSSNIFFSSSAATGISNGVESWVRVTLDVDNGASQHEVKFFTSTDGTTWTQLGTTRVGSGVTSIYSGSAPVTIGSQQSDWFFAGRILRAQIFNGIDGTKVFDADATTVSLNASSFTAITGQTVTINGARLIGSPQNITNLGTAGSLLPTTVGSTTAADSNDPRFLDHTGTNYVYLPGVASNYLSVPDAAALDITGDIDLRVQLAADDWLQSTSPIAIAKHDNSSNRSYALRISNSGGIIFLWSTDGSTTLSELSGGTLPFANGATGWIRATLDVDNGAGQYEVKFYTSTNGVNWTNFSTKTGTTGTTSIFSGTAPVAIGVFSNFTSNPLAGKVYRAQIFDGIDGTKVLDVDTSTLQTGADAYIVPVTYSGAAGARFTGSGLALPGTANNYATSPDSAALDVTGDLDIRCKVALTSWSPSTTQVLVSKWGTGTSRSYSLYVENVSGTGRIFLRWTPDGTAGNRVEVASVATGITDGSIKWVRATLDVNNGASGRDIRFFTSDDGTTWTQLGTTTTQAGTTSIFAGTDVLAIGSHAADFNTTVNGTIYQAQVLNGIDGTVAFNANFEGVPADSLRMTESARKATVSLVTTRYCAINRGTSGRKTVAVTQPTWLFGSDDYMEVNNRYMSSGTYLYLPGVNSNNAAAPDSAAISITGDLDIRCKVALDDWTPAAATTLISKNFNWSYELTVQQTTGLLILQLSTDGTTALPYVSTAAPTVADGATLWVRATRVASTGVVKFFTSTDGTTWTQLGVDVTGVTGNLFDSGASLSLGGRTASNPLRGKLFRAQILNGIDGTVAFDANFETSITSLNQASFTESSANAATVTINRSGSAFRSAGITTAGYLYPGATNTFAASALDHLNFSATDSFSVLLVGRYWANFNNGRPIDKASNNYPGYIFNISLNTGAYYVSINDATISRNVGISDITAFVGSGQLFTAAAARNTNTDTISGYRNGRLDQTASDTTVGTLSDPGPLTIGRRSIIAQNYTDMEFIAAAIWRRVLTAPEISTIVNYFNERD